MKSRRGNIPLFLYLNQMKAFCVFLVFVSFRLVGQQVTFTHVSQFPFQNFEVIESGDTIQLFAEDNWSYPVHVDLNGFQNGVLNFRIVDLDLNSCFPDQFKVYLIPDPNFESSCLNPSGANYLSPDFAQVNIEGGDTVVIQPEGYVQCSGCNQFRYFVELDQVILDSFDIRVCQSLANLDQTIQTTFAIFPNPTYDQINWNSNEAFSHYAIYDLHGKLVERNILDGGKSIAISKLQEGSYTLELEGFEGQIIYSRFVIQR
jgi:hypothetical protein